MVFLSAERESGTFRRTFSVQLGVLSNAVEVRMLHHIYSRVCSALGDVDVSLSSTFAIDDEEHSLCEWIKAVRNRSILNTTAETARKRLRTSALMGGFNFLLCLPRYHRLRTFMSSQPVARELTREIR